MDINLFCIYYGLHNVYSKYLITIAAASTVSSSVMVKSLPQISSISTPVVKSSSMEYSQHNILSQPSSCVTIVSDTHTTSSCSPVTTLSVVECLTTSSSVVTSISGQVASTVTATAGEYTYNIHIKSVVAHPHWV